MESAVAAISLAFAVLMAPKAWNLLRSIKWALDHGQEFAADVLLETTDRKPMDLLRLRTGDAYFLPFGAKSIRVERAIENRLERMSGWNRWFVQIAFKIVRVLYFNTPVNVLLSSAIVVLASCLTPMASIPLAFTVVVYCMILQFEVILWFTLTSEYSRVWGSLKSEPARRALGDVAGLGGVLLLATVGMTAATALLLSANFFREIPPAPAITSPGARVAAASYYVFTSFATVGGAPIEPISGLGYLMGSMVMVSVLLTIGFFVSAIASRGLVHRGV